MSLRVVGQHKGSISLDLDTATVLDLKEAVSRDSGLPVSGLKLLAGAEEKVFSACLLYRSTGVHTDCCKLCTYTQQ